MKKVTAVLFLIGLVSVFSFSEELVISNSSHMYNLDPHTANYADEAQLFSGLYEGLFSYDPRTLEPVPGVAEGFKISRDKRTWTFTIRENAKFSNGEAITAQSVVDSWKALLDLRKNAPFSSMLDFVLGYKEYRVGQQTDFSKLGFRVADDRTLVVTLRSPTEHFSKILCHHAFSVVHPDKNVFSGAFVIQENSMQQIVLGKNPHYWDNAAVELDKITVLLTDDPAENTQAFNRGEIHWLAGDMNAEQILDQRAVLVSMQFGTEFLFFKTDMPLVNNEDFRNALLYALDWNKLREKSLKKAETLVSPFLGYPEVLGLGDQDLIMAKSLLEKSGYNAEKSAPIIIFLPNDEYSVGKGQLLVDCWKQIGVNVRLQTTEISRYLDEVSTSPAHVFSYIWIADFADPLAFLELFRGSSNLNESRWSSKQFDYLLEKAAQTRDQKERLKKLAEAEQVLLDSGVIMPISHTISLNVVDLSVVSGWYDNALDIHPFKYIKLKKAAPPNNLVRMVEVRQ